MPRKLKFQHRKKVIRERRRQRGMRESSDSISEPQSSISDSADSQSISTNSSLNTSEQSPASSLNTSEQSPASSLNTSEQSPASSLNTSEQSPASSLNTSEQSPASSLNTSEQSPASSLNTSSDQSPVDSDSILSNSSLDCLLSVNVSLTPSPISVSPPCTPLVRIHSNLVLPSRCWSDHSSLNNLNEILICKISPHMQPLTVTHSLRVSPDLSWSLHINEHLVNLDCCTMLQPYSGDITTAEKLNQLVEFLDRSKVCVGQPDDHFVRMVSVKKGKMFSRDGSKVVAFVDHFKVELNGKVYQQTVCTSKCELASSVLKCPSCTSYRAQLRSSYHRWVKRHDCGAADSTDSTSTTDADSITKRFKNDRYLNTPEKILKISALRKRVHTAEQTVLTLRKKIRMLYEVQGDVLVDGLHSDLVSIMTENSDMVKEVYPEGSFARLFWDEQLKAATASSPTQVRWHPVIIKWCLNLKLMSTSTYHALRTSGFIKLPSERTLRDYTHLFENKPGFQDEVNQQLLLEIERMSLPTSKRYVALLLDEMKVKEGLVFHKTTGEMMGFVNLGDINQQLMELEKQDTEKPILAKQILTIMVRGVLFKLEFPYAHFCTRGVTGEELHPITWEAIHRLEASEVKVICITADGASPNRKFFRMHKIKGDPSTYVHKALNPFSEVERWVYFFADPPHLVKTIRNCWSHSGENGTRRMKVNGHYIEWKHLEDLYGKLRATNVGLSLVPKLKREHIFLSSFSRMRVDLAVQVLSKSVADSFRYFEDPETKETEIFVRYFDRFFDMLNVRSLDEWVRKRKPDLKPYSSVDDTRFEWLDKVFLKYLMDWEDEVQGIDSLTAEQKKRMTLSRETLEGIQITTTSFIEMAKFLLSQPGNESSTFLLSERISQDPLENYFGQQRARGGRNENPTVTQCLHNAAAIRVQKSQVLDPVRGNCTRRKILEDKHTNMIDDTPLSKRKRRRCRSAEKQ